MGRREAQGACPRWCVADHAREDEAGEVRHRGVTEVLTVALRQAHGRRFDRGAPVTELLIELHQTVGDNTVWLYIGDGADQRLELSRESAAQLALVLSRVAG
ncbi:MAG: DUF6907 domain-containing protein [Microbacteriaceae bacterium]